MPRSTSLTLLQALLVSLSVAAVPAGPAWSQQVAGGGSSADLFAAMRKAVVAAKPSLARPVPVSPGVPLITLLDCLDPELDLGINPGDSDHFPVLMAMQVEQAQASLRALGTPEALWRPSLDRWVRLGEQHLAEVQARPGSAEAIWPRFDQAATQAGDTLLRDVNRQLRQRQPRAPEVVLSDGCGAGETAVNIQTKPPGGRVTYIPLFRYRLCEARGLTPQDPRVCRGWVDVTKPEEFLSGRYAYRVRWPDGQVSSGVFDAEQARLNDRSGSDVARVVLSR